ncbi:MAG TPA: hypothetical protein VGO49_22645 [Bradyrhizobium sp.]|jgi:hypothetical protein|nr:hypothetical protein [Bradyrhizobium sp.]
MAAPDATTKEPPEAGAPEISDVEVTCEMIAAASAVWGRYDLRDVLEIDSDIMRETLKAALSVWLKGRSEVI